MLWLLDEPFGAGRAESVSPAVLDTRSNGSCTPPWDLKGFARILSSAGGEPGLVSVREVANQLGVHPETVRRLIHDGRLDAVRVGRVLRVHRQAVDSFLARQRVKPTRFQA
jgi:excisionase family DNA binding protein